MKNWPQRIDLAIRSAQPRLRKAQAKRLDKLIRLYSRDSREVAALLANPHTNKELGVSCAWVLGIIRDKHAIDALRRGLHTNSKELVWECALALPKIGGREPERALLVALKRGITSQDRIAAISALGNMCSKRAVPHLTKLLENRRLPPKMRGEAAEALGKIAGDRVCNSLLDATYDESAEVRFWAVYALGQAGCKKALQRLKELARDKSEVQHWGSVSREAKEALRHVSSTGLGPKT